MSKAVVAAPVHASAEAHEDRWHVFLREVEIPPLTPVPAPWLRFNNSYSAAIPINANNNFYTPTITSHHPCVSEFTIDNTCKLHQSEHCVMISTYLEFPGASVPIFFLNAILSLTKVSGCLGGFPSSRNRCKLCTLVLTYFCAKCRLRPCLY